MKKLLITLVCAVALTACADNEPPVPPPHEEVMTWGANCIKSINTLSEQGFPLGIEGQRGLDQCLSLADWIDLCNAEQLAMFKKVDERVSELLGVDPETFMCVTSE